MGFKSLTMGLALALLISAPLTTEASVYEKEASMEFNTIDVQIGKTGDFVELPTLLRCGRRGFCGAAESLYRKA